MSEMDNSCTCGSPYYDLGEHAVGCPSTSHDAGYAKGRTDALNDAARVAEGWCCSKQAAGAANATFASINISAAILALATTPTRNTSQIGEG